MPKPVNHGRAIQLTGEEQVLLIANPCGILSRGHKWYAQRRKMFGEVWYRSWVWGCAKMRRWQRKHGIIFFVVGDEITYLRLSELRR